MVLHVPRVHEHDRAIHGENMQGNIDGVRFTRRQLQRENISFRGWPRVLLQVQFRNGQFECERPIGNIAGFHFDYGGCPVGRINPFETQLLDFDADGISGTRDTSDY